MAVTTPALRSPPSRLRSRLTFGLLAVIASACGSFDAADRAALPVDPAPPPCARDLQTDSDNCGVCGNQCGAGTVCEAGACRAGCPDRVLYVSGEGNDGNDGCSRERPIRTVAAAIALAATQKLERHELHVCRGTYAEEGVRLEVPVSIRGGYNCSTWTRGDGFGKAGGFADINATHLVVPRGGAGTTTLTIAGEAITRDVLIEGLTLQGPEEGNATGTALLVKTGASPLLSELVLRGGATSSATGTGSIAAAFQSKSRAELKDSLLHGGAGSGATGSIGVVVDDAQPSLHDNAIDAGAGKGSAIGAVAVLVGGKEETAFATLERNRLGWERATATAAFVTAAMGLRVTAGSVEATGNVIRGGTAVCTLPWCFVMGVNLEGAARSKLHANTITLGALVPPAVADAGPAWRFGVRIGGKASQPIELVGNVIHAGGAGLPANVFPIGIDVLAGNGHLVQANTVAGPSSTSSGQWGIRVGAPGYVVKDVSLRGNLFVGISSSVVHASCHGSSFAAVRNNLFVAGTSDAITFVDSPGTAGGCGYLFPYPVGMEALDPTRRADNRAIRPECSGTSCVPGVACTDLTTCAGQVFDAWHVASLGVDTVERPAGLRLRVDGRCAVNRGGDAPATLDLYGRARTAPFSFGAAEEDGCK